MTELHDADVFRRRHPDWPNVSPDEYPRRDRWAETIAVTGNEPTLADWAGSGFQANRDVSGAVAANGDVVSDADPGL